jgi:hypothetical protein
VPASAPDALAAGALAIIHAAPAAAIAREIPADSVGGFVYTGGSLQLADLKDHGVRYNGLNRRRVAGMAARERHRAL